MTDAQGITVLAEAGVRQVKEMREILRGAGIDAHLLNPPATRGT